MNVNDISTLVEDEVRNEIFKPFVDKCVGGEVIVEIGTFVGGNLCRVAQMIKESNKNIKLYGIDNFHFVNISDQAINNVGLRFGQYDTKQESFLKALTDNIVNNDLKDLIEIIDSDSIEASTFFNNNSIDLLFIDGAHAYPYVKDELTIWIPKVKNGGIIAGHDWPCDGIQRGVYENLPHHQINVVTGNGAYWIIK